MFAWPGLDLSQPENETRRQGSSSDAARSCFRAGECRLRVDVASNVSHGVSVVEPGHQPAVAQPGTVVSRLDRIQSSYSVPAHLDPSLSLIWRLVVGCDWSTSNWIAVGGAAVGGAGARAGALVGAKAGSVSAPSLLPLPPNGPLGALGCLAHFSPVLLAMRSSTGWSWRMLSSDNGARL